MLDPAKVPRNLRPLLPWAEQFGIADDLLRENFVKLADREELNELVSAVREYDEALDQWLAGPESKGPDFSDEYIAFSAMRMASDYASAT